MSDLVYTDNAASLLTTIINAIDDPATASVTASDGAKFPVTGTNSQNGQPNWFAVVGVRASDNAIEKFKATRSGDTFTLVRAQGGTTKIAFAVGDALYLGNTKEFFDELLLKQDAQYGNPYWCGTAGGSANALTLTGSPTVTGLSAGLTLEFIAASDITATAVTVQADATAAKNLKDAAGGALSLGDIASGGLYRIQYSGTEWRLVSGTALSSAVARAAISRNRIINGDMRIDQRNSGSSVTITAGAALQWVVDGWYAYCTGANLTMSHGITTDDIGLNGAVGVTGVGFGHRIESRNARSLVGDNATLSVAMSNSGLATVNWAAYYPTTEDAFGTVATPTRTLIASGSFTGLTATSAVFSATFVVPSGAFNGIEIVFTAGAQPSGSAWRITNAQLEPGQIATPFEYQSYTTELAKCQRYYEAGSYSLTLPVSNASVIASFLSHVDFKATKFRVPTITGTNAQGGTFDSSSVTVDSMNVGRSDVVANRNNSGTWTAVASIP